MDSGEGGGGVIHSTFVMSVDCSHKWLGWVGLKQGLTQARIVGLYIRL